MNEVNQVSRYRLSDPYLRYLRNEELKKLMNILRENDEIEI